MPNTHEIKGRDMHFRPAAFVEAVTARAIRNAAKWGTGHDAAHTALEWAAIASWQLGLLQIELMNMEPFDEKAAMERIAKVCAPMFDMYSRCIKLTEGCR